MIPTLIPTLSTEMSAQVGGLSPFTAYRLIFLFSFLRADLDPMEDTLSLVFPTPVNGSSCMHHSLYNALSLIVLP